MKKILLLIFLASLTINTSYAYWSDTYPVSNYTEAVIIVGTWLMAEEWVENQMYQEGDVVYHNGAYYVRTGIGSAVVGGKFPPDSFIGWLFWSPT